MVRTPGRWASCLTGAMLCLAMVGCGGGEPKKIVLCNVTINTEPEQGAAITIDGVVRGVSPLKIEDLPPGSYEAIGKKADFDDGYQSFDITSTEPQSVTVHLEPFIGYLSIDCVPEGAEITLDGEPAGKTPLVQKALKVGKHSYELKVANYYPASEELDVQRDYKYDKKHELKPIESTLSVTTKPTGAILYINNQQQKQMSPAKFTLPAGKYLVGAWSKGYVQDEVKAELTPNSTTAVELQLKAGDVPQGMVLVPAGDFVWGSVGRAPDEAPKRTENLKAFYIDKFEVTNAQFKEVFKDYEYPKGLDLHPATHISWNEAMKYAQAVGKRLPTEAEWEKAARGPDGREYPWGDQFEAYRCNTVESEVETTTRVGERLEGASPYGLMDAAGNVAEWTFDWYDAYPGNRDVTKDYGQVFRVVRGGSYLTEKFDARCARRRFDKVDSEKPDYGLRCAKDVEEVKN